MLAFVKRHGLEGIIDKHSDRLHEAGPYRGLEQAPHHKVASAISSSVPTPPKGTWANVGSISVQLPPTLQRAFRGTPCLTFPSWKALPWRPVWTVPGESAFTEIPFLATALASAAVIAITAAVAAEESGVRAASTMQPT
jgi:hypothetical protein